jgi:hypothetical protein
MRREKVKVKKIGEIIFEVKQKIAKKRVLKEARPTKLFYGLFL